MAIACVSTESGTGPLRRANAASRHGGGSGVDALRVSARWASSTALTRIDAPSDADGQVVMIVGATGAAGVGVGAGVGVAGAQAAATMTTPTRSGAANRRRPMDGFDWLKSMDTKMTHCHPARSEAARP